MWDILLKYPLNAPRSSLSKSSFIRSVFWSDINVLYPLVWVYFYCDRCDRVVTVEKENGLYVVTYPEVCSVAEVSQSYFSGPIFGRHILDES